MATRWQPDTCSCILEFDGIKGDEFINPVVVKLCKQHKQFHETVDYNRTHKRNVNGTVVPRDQKE